MFCKHNEHKNRAGNHEVLTTHSIKISAPKVTLCTYFGNPCVSIVQFLSDLSCIKITTNNACMFIIELIRFHCPSHAYYQVSWILDMGQKNTSKSVIMGIELWSEIIFEIRHQFIAAPWHHMATYILVNISLGIGLLPDDSKPIFEPILTYRQRYLVSFTYEQP